MGAKNQTRTDDKRHDKRRNDQIVCACGCGGKLEKYKYYYAPSLCREIRKERRFIHGHNGRGIPRTKIVKEKIRVKVKKWHKDVGHSKETIEKIRKTQLEKREYYREIQLGEKNSMWGKHLSIEARRKIADKLRGELSYNWKGGKSYWRGEDWDMIRRECYKRDKYKCQDCGVHRSKKILSAHHLEPYDESEDNSLENLITLCISCHGKRHGRGIKQYEKK